MKTIKYDKKSNKPYDHLEPLINFLINNGNSLSRDYRWGQNRSGYFCFLEKPIDFSSIEMEFSIPNYIVLDREHDRIDCNKTWTTIVGNVQKT